MYATINDNRLDITHSGTRSPDARGAELDVDTVFNELVADASTPTLDAGVVLRTPQARCADGNGTLTHLFFSDDVLSIARAKAICSKCKLAPSCLDGALDRAEPWGVWGGELIDSGR
ncbi:MAG: putative WhiB family transcriptional regulator, partial [Acidimicrobiaceae bacterium]